MPKITDIKCHRIVNSRAEWTIQTKVFLDDGSVGVQTIPDGASKGENEAVFLPVDKAVKVVTSVIRDALKGEDPYNQDKIDRILVDMDGTGNKSHLGGNSILSVSLGVANASAQSKGLELYEYLSILYSGEKMSKNPSKFPTPVFNILNGGKHANNGLSFQEFMVIPAKDVPFDKAMDIGVNVYNELEKKLKKAGHDVDVGDEGGFAPNGFNVRKALDFIKDAISTDYRFGDQVFMGMDVAAESFWTGHKYEIPEEKLSLTSKELGEYHSKLLKDYPIIFLEDPFYEKDEDGWRNFYEMTGDKVMVVGDDLVVTNPKILETAINNRLLNAVIVKPNQVGSLTETLEFIRIAKKSGLNVCVSHRSGDTAKSTFIADLALGVSAEFIKSGAPVRGERVAKYNRLLDIFYES